MRIIYVIGFLLAWCAFISWVVRRVKQVTYNEALIAHYKHAATDRDMETLNTRGTREKEKTRCDNSLSPEEKVIKRLRDVGEIE